MEYLTLLTLPFLISLIWLTALHLPAHTPPPKQTPILLLISHPDDEAMFFSPTLLSLTAPDLNNDVRVICLSSGNSDGVGNIRTSELVESCRRLGIRDASLPGAGTVYSQEGGTGRGGRKFGKVIVVEDERLHDGMGVVWDSEYISSTIDSILHQWSTQEEGGEDGWTPSITLTFDPHGVSSHSNHISAYHGAKHFIRHTSPATKLYTLTTTSLPRKYLSILDFPITYFSLGRGKNSLLFVLGPEGFKKARGAMTGAHVSQMRWFRWGWIWLSRYMVVNDLLEEDVLGRGGSGGSGSGSGKVGGQKEL
ncbi:LmbE-like protein [Terfezia boudieri ATCC MYA-4762]|uniref:N-acetylglucosaminylphosphatidylinositol deacetylase n=1 Tax=Terfezia boudieri ATCC MYA-4762 TaxID=1051890 RepID=A0A3N4M3L8_9PEZI|nr:LmbE-like protein [Terfezia boudieri ATCC MYA-4762]